MGVRIVFLLDCHLVLSLLKYRSVGAFKKKKKKRENLKQGNLLNSSIDNKMMICFLNL